MKIYITETYTNARFNFDINYRVFNYLDKCFNGALKIAQKITKANDIELMVFLDTKRIKKVKVDKRRNDLFVFIPYDIIKESNRFLYDFIELVINTISKVLIEEYSIPAKYLKDVDKKCKKEIIGNPKYIFREEG